MLLKIIFLFFSFSQASLLNHCSILCASRLSVHSALVPWTILLWPVQQCSSVVPLVLCQQAIYKLSARTEDCFVLTSGEKCLVCSGTHLASAQSVERNYCVLFFCTTHLQEQCARKASIVECHSEIVRNSWSGAN